MKCWKCNFIKLSLLLHYDCSLCSVNWVWQV
jgi:hypothetical protein